MGAEPRRYSAVAVALHWLIAAGIVTNMVLAWGLDAFDERGYTFKKNFHEGMGMTILLLSLFRLFWRLTHKPPPLSDSLTSFEKRAAHAVHVLLYVFMIATPLAGWLALSANPPGRPPFLLYGYIPLPLIPPLQHWPAASQPALHDAFAQAHHIFAFALLALLVVHVAGALKHHLIDRDETLGRMIPFLRRSLP